MQNQTFDIIQVRILFISTFCPIENRVEDSFKYFLQTELLRKQMKPDFVQGIPWEAWPKIVHRQPAQLKAKFTSAACPAKPAEKRGDGGSVYESICL